ncbi:MAG: protein kinase domain-containing protein [Bryobacteraceae bacterium]
MTGQTLGHYQILEKLGSGGMGDVYKARDTRLNRLVAIKVLPPDKVANPDRKRRFIQEAQAASALNHPNIVIIHDIQEAGGVTFLVMEYIAGKTLDAAIPRQGMRLGEALKLAIPIADGLAKAHSAGIIHRDVKPANVMIAEDGRVKILDFGLAKLTEVGSITEEDATRTVGAHTEEGAILGTISYMSPEQAEGKKLDARSDIFSFGAMFYEMLTGRKAFQGESRISTLSAILREDPKPPENLPAEVDRILRRCLRKDPARRFHSMVDVKVELEEVREESDSGKLSAPVAVAPAKRNWIPLVALGSLLVAAVAGMAWYANRPKPAPELRLRQLTADSGLSTTPALSPDGKLVAYASDRAGEGNLDLWVQPLTEGARPIRLTKDLSDDQDPSFSPDGGLIAFRSNRGDGGIYLVPSLGGDERLLVRGGHYPRFSPDGQWVAYSSSLTDLTESKVFVVPAAGGSPKQVGADIPVALGPVWSPDGKSLLVTGQDGVGDRNSRNFWLAPVAGGKSRKTEIATLLTGNRLSLFSGMDWRGQSLLFTGRSSVWALDLEPGSFKSGNLRKITTGTASLRGVRGTETRFVFSSGMDSDHLWTLPLDLNTGKVTGPLQAVSHSGGSQWAPASSSDGRVLAYTQLNPGGGELRVRDNGSGRESVLVTRQARPKVSPDGSRVAYAAFVSGSGAIYLMDAAGGQARKLVDFEKGGQIYGWTADGNALVFYRNAPIRFFLYDLNTGKEREMISHPKLDVHGAEPSPDRKWVAFHFPAVANHPVKIAPLREGRAAGESEWITVAEYPGRNVRPWWSPDGNLLYFLSMKDNYPDIWAQRLHPVTKRPVGDAFAVYHFHETRKAPNIYGAASFGPAIGRNQITFSLLDQSANIWIAEQMQ